MYHRSPRPSRARTSRRRLLAAVAGGCAATAAATLVGFGVAGAAPGSPGATPTDLSTLVPTGSLSIAGPAPAPGDVAAQRMFAVLNQQRAANGLGPLAWSPQLVQSSLAHNQAMAAANTLSHQLPGEADFGARIAATGYRWRAIAENIGWNGQATDDGAVALQWMFYNETPPDDGHRRNILSTATTQVGISVYFDGRGKVWVTEDFGAPA